MSVVKEVGHVLPCLPVSHSVWPYKVVSNFLQVSVSWDSATLTVYVHSC